MVSTDEKPKPLSFTRVAGLDGLEINLVSKQDLFKEQFVLILKFLMSLVMSKLMNYQTSYLPCVG